jgi:hypothetical protein
MAAGDLTVLATVKSWLGITATTDDATLTRLISAASTLIQNYLNRTIAVASYTETRNGNGRNRLTLANTPLVSVQSVTVGAATIQPFAGSPGHSGYWFEPGGTTLYLAGAGFDYGIQNVQLAYTAGYATTPLDIEQATIELIALRYRERDRIGQISKGLASETTTFTQADMTQSIKTALAPYKNWIAL